MQTSNQIFRGYILKCVRFIKSWAKILCQSMFISGIVIMSVIPFSCKVSTEGMQIVKGDILPPVLDEVIVRDSKSIQLIFSEQVTVKDWFVSPVAEDDGVHLEQQGSVETISVFVDIFANQRNAVDATLDYDESGKIVTFVFADDMVVGQMYELCGTVEDSAGNSITFAVPFSGFNSRVPLLMMTELKTSTASQSKSEKENDFYRTEFVEILALSGGNLAGLELVSAYDGEERKYVFPAIDVKKGEIFVVHLRTRGVGCVSEEGEDLTLATTSYTNPNVRDLWCTNDKTCFGDKTDIVFIRNSGDSKILDVVMYRDSEVTEWNEKFNEFLTVVDDCGIYEDSSIDNASDASSLTTTKTISRVGMNEILLKVNNGNELGEVYKSGVNSWIVTKATPGEIMQE